jgi:hypothetical protein
MQPHRPTDADRRLVLTLASHGVRRDLIAEAVGVSEPTLRRHYAVELEVGFVTALAAVAGALLRAALRGNTTAQVFWLKARGGPAWSTRDRIEVITPHHRQIAREIARDAS